MSLDHFVNKATACNIIMLPPIDIGYLALGDVFALKNIRALLNT